MNADVGELIKRIKIDDPFTLGAIVGLVISIVLAGVMASSLVKAIGERRDLSMDYEATLSAIQQIQAGRKWHR